LSIAARTCRPWYGLAYPLSFSSDPRLPRRLPVGGLEDRDSPADRQRRSPWARTCFGPGHRSGRGGL